MIKSVQQFVSKLAFLFVVGLIAILPFPVLYGLSNFLAWLFGGVIKYRHKVIYNNLSQTDLNLDETQKEKLISEFYRNLSDMLLEGLKSFSMGRKSVMKRHKVLNPELLDQYYKNCQSVILVTGHTANWEWGSLSAGLFSGFNIIAFYSPLRNKQIDKLLRWSRSRFGTTLCPTKGTTNTFEANKNQPTLYLMAADQSPARVASAHWIEFLGKPTAFLHGPEKHARQNNYPVVFAEIIRIKRGYYELTLKTIEEQPDESEPESITRKYARELEKYIRKYPSNWLWSHRRWKHKPSLKQ